MKQVKNQVKQVKKDFELDIMNLIKKGLNPSKIAVHLNISLPNLSYYLSSLKKQNVIKKVGYGVWEVIPSGEVKILSHKGSSQVKDVRGHAFIWKIRPQRKIDWKKILDEKGISYKLKGIAKTPGILVNNKKVWLGKNNITIFEPKWNSFFATNPIESKKEAVFEMIRDIEEIKKISGDFKFNFTCRRQHYGFVNNPDAMHFNRKGKKILIKNEKGYWFSIDFSQNQYKEAETIHEKDADIDGVKYQNYMNSHEKTNFDVTPEFLLKAIDGLRQNQVEGEKNITEFAIALNKHIPAYEGMANKVNELNIIIKELSNQIKKLGSDKNANVERS